MITSNKFKQLNDPKPLFKSAHLVIAFDEEIIYHNCIELVCVIPF